MHTNLFATCFCLCLFGKRKKEYFPYSIECPTSIWLLVSATTPSGSAPRLSGLYVIFIRQSTAAGEPKAFSSKGERRAGHPLGASASPPHPEWNKATETRRDASHSPGDFTSMRGPTPGSPCKAPPAPAATHGSVAPRVLRRLALPASPGSYCTC